MREMRRLRPGNPQDFARVGHGFKLGRRVLAALRLRALTSARSAEPGQPRCLLTVPRGIHAWAPIGAVVALVWLGFSVPTVSAETDTPRQTTRTVLGWAEHAILQPWGRKLKARLDTGANTASLHATDIEEFEKNGDDWVRFEFDHEDHDEIEIERPVVRYIRIIEEDRRPVVELDFCLNETRYTAEFSLTDRGSLTYPMLLGRRFLAGVALIDPAKRYLAEPDCPCQPEEKAD